MTESIVENNEVKKKMYAFVSEQTYKDVFAICRQAKMPVGDFVRLCIEQTVETVNKQVYGDFRPIENNIGDLPF